jgi:SAM-dependent methyltransferase
MSNNSSWHCRLIRSEAVKEHRRDSAVPSTYSYVAKAMPKIASVESPGSQLSTLCSHGHYATDYVPDRPRSLYEELQEFAQAVDMQGWKAGTQDFLQAAPDSSRGEFYRTMSFDRAGWRFLLGHSSLDRILCLDTLFGSTALELSTMCRQLSVIQVNVHFLQVIQQRLHDAGVTNTDYTYISPYSMLLPFPDHSFDGFILSDLAMAFPQQTVNKAAPAPAGFRKLFAEVHRVLKCDGVLYVGARNRYGYTRWRKTLTGKRSSAGAASAMRWASWRQIRQSVRQVGFQTVHTYRLVMDDDQLVEVVLERRYRSVKNRFTSKEAVKEVLLSEPLGSWVAPAYGLVAFKGKSSVNFLDRLITDLEQKGVLPARTQESFVVKRYQILSGKVILSVGQACTPYGEKIIVLPLDAMVAARRRHEAAMLEALACTGVQLASMIPTFYGEGCVHRQQYFVQSELPGVSVDVDGPWLHEVTQRAAQVLCTFHAETAQSHIVDNAVFTRLFSHPLQCLIDKLGPAIKDSVEPIEAALRDQVWGKWLPSVWTHGDYKIENVLIDRHTCALQGVIDWDLSQPEGLPLLDLLYLIAYNRVICEGKVIADFFLDHILPKRFSPFEESIYHAYIRDLSIDYAIIDALHIMFWVNHVAYRVESSQFLEYMLERMRAVTRTIAKHLNE